MLSFAPVPRNFEAVVSDFMGTARLHVPFREVPASASLNPNGFHGVPGEVISVPATSIDAVIPSGVKVDAAKIDVETFEDRVLEDMTSVLGESRPRPRRRMFTRRSL